MGPQVKRTVGFSFSYVVFVLHSSLSHYQTYPINDFFFKDYIELINYLSIWLKIS